VVAPPLVIRSTALKLVVVAISPLVIRSTALKLVVVAISCGLVLLIFVAAIALETVAEVAPLATGAGVVATLLVSQAVVVLVAGACARDVDGV
jgi:hypothetical protein